MMTIDRTAYRNECRARWSGFPLGDAMGNWQRFVDRHEILEESMRAFHRDPQLEDAAGKCHNPDGTLTACLWKLARAAEPDAHRLGPFLGFCEHYQKVHLARGLMIYATLILRELEQTSRITEPDTLVLT